MTAAVHRTPISGRALAAATGVLALVSTLLSYQVTRASGRPVLYVELAILNTSYWVLWAVMAPAIARLAQRFPFDGGTWRRALAVHLPAAALFSVFNSLGIALVRRALAVAAGRAAPSSVQWAFQQSLSQTIDWNMMAYWMIVGAALAIAYREEARVRALTAARLETQLVQAQLRALESQLHPHFLFNALNAVAALMHRDMALAERTLVRLGELLRSTLRHVGRRDVPLQEELEFTRNYVDVEQTRFQNRLTVRFDVAPETLDALVPWMLLQPLVENAVKHGIAPQSRPGTIEIAVRRDDSWLRIAVRDDGAGVKPDVPSAVPAGTGLATVRARLQVQFGDNHEFEFRRQPRGVEVRIAIPWQQDDAAADRRSRTAHVYGT
jgi:two-component system LytT family sensor kinase